jgi:putative ABC transport system permease protein
MLFGDPAKYLTLVLGLAFAALLMNQQGAIFLGLLNQSTGPLQNVHQADLWVTDPGTPWVAEFRPLSDSKLGRVRSVPGVEWAEPFFNGQAITELDDGTFKRVQILGLSRTTLAGRPPEMVEGRIEDLWIPDAIIVENTSRSKLGTGLGGAGSGGVNIGDVLKINDRRAVIVGFCKARLGFESNAIIYTTFENAVRFTPVGRERISYVLVSVRPGADAAQVQRDINALGDVVALTRQEFRLQTMRFIMVATGIGVNFGITIALGFFVGLFLSAAVFYQFTLENLRYFATLKALGAGRSRLLAMVLVQALTVGAVGYCLGTGMAGAFTVAAQEVESELSAYFPWQLALGSFVGTMLTITLGSVLSLRRVLTVDPAVVFSGR